MLNYRLLLVDWIGSCMVLGSISPSLNLWLIPVQSIVHTVDCWKWKCLTEACCTNSVWIVFSSRKLRLCCTTVIAKGLQCHLAGLLAIFQSSKLADLRNPFSSPQNINFSIFMWILKNNWMFPVQNSFFLQTQTEYLWRLRENLQISLLRIRRRDATGLCTKGWKKMIFILMCAVNHWLSQIISFSLLPPQVSYISIGTGFHISHPIFCKVIFQPCSL